MKCTYEMQVRAQCPVNPSDTDIYAVTIESEALIEVEKIVKFFAEHGGDKNIFQEALTQMAAVTIGAKVTTTGFHSGVRVTCVAP